MEDYPKTATTKDLNELIEKAKEKGMKQIQLTVTGDYPDSFQSDRSETDGWANINGDRKILQLTGLKVVTQSLHGDNEFIETQIVCRIAQRYTGLYSVLVNVANNRHCGIIPAAIKLKDFENFAKFVLGETDSFQVGTKEEGYFETITVTKETLEKCPICKTKLESNRYWIENGKCFCDHMKEHDFKVAS